MSLLTYSSLLFSTNIATALYKQYYLYALFFLGLTITSVIVHNYKTGLNLLLDKIFILAIVLYGAYLLIQKWRQDPTKYTEFAFIVSTFILTIYLYIFGYFTNTYCYHPDKAIGTAYHSILHLISSIGHHSIIFL